MLHYYTPHPIAEHDVKLIDATLRGRRRSFYTDSGVFSKSAVDYGSEVLIETMTIPAGASVLDMGCGWGPIGISAAVLNPTGKVLMADINTRALDLAARNIKLHGIENAEVIQSDIYSNLAGHMFDVILTNPPIRAGKSVVHSIFIGAAEHLNPGGSLWVVIQKKQGAPSAEKALKELFSQVHIRERSKGYYVFEAVVAR
ncbi:MAG: class I SAM-dependent methyltransferase [Bacillota bacterium]|nr:class I SAM-dependent methyltransferase [Bacillota bacterium]